MMMKKLTAIILIYFLVFLSGCTQQIRPSLKTYTGTERIFDKNYSVGQQLSVYVGQPIIKVKDYKIKKYTSKHMRASSAFSISGGIVNMSGDSVTDYIIDGETTINNEIYKVVNIPSGNMGKEFGALIESNGSVYNKVLNGNIIMIYNFDISPPNLKFTSSDVEEIDIDSGYLNYELIYGGTDGKSIMITYREYTSSDMARPAFYQSLVYQKGVSQIRFRDLVLSVQSTSSEQIIYTVVSDGL